MNHLSFIERRTVGQCIRYCRWRTGISQGALAQRVGIPRAQLSRIERDQRPATDLLEPIADALGVDLVALLPLGRPMARAG